MTSEGIYRKSGVNSRVTALCDRFRRDARSLRLKEGEHQVDDVSNTLKRFFRELEEGLFTSEYAYSWLAITGNLDTTAHIQLGCVNNSGHKIFPIDVGPVFNPC